MIFTTNVGNVSYNNDQYGLFMCKQVGFTEILLLDNTNTICSAFRIDGDVRYSALDLKAKEVYEAIARGLSFCNAKNAVPDVAPIGAVTRHSVLKNSDSYSFELFGSKNIYSAQIHTKKFSINLLYDTEHSIPDGIPYVELLNTKITESQTDDEYIPMRTVAEIALYKDTSWLRDRKYYIVNDEETAEKLFNYFDTYDGPIAYDTETTGLRINCFGKIGSKYADMLEQYNRENPDEQIRSDKLVGIILTVEEKTSYYFPVRNRKFKNLYQDKDNPIRKKIIRDIRNRYAVGDRSKIDGDMKEYISKTADDDIPSDVILMERCRDILSKKHIVTHRGSFEWKVGWIYEIDTNILDDTLALHATMYKFKNADTQSGEPSDLKFLARKEFGIDQWELSDFFPSYSEDSGRIKGGKKRSKIDFSYMEYDGARIYAPCDGDMTLSLYNKYIADLYKNHAEQEYLYRFEVTVTCALGYCEFYGIRIDETKVPKARLTTIHERIEYEHLMRKAANIASDKENRCYEYVTTFKEALDELRSTNGSAKEVEDTEVELDKAYNNLRTTMDSDEENPLNISSPAQMSHLFYDVLGIPLKDGQSRSVSKNAIEAALKFTNEDGSLKYPAVDWYKRWAKANSEFVKFFNALPQFMYPGGFMFASFNQFVRTGRMSCKEPNLQQLPKQVTKIIVPREGFIQLDADYSQIEARVITALAHNDGLAKLFSDPDNDYHTLMASMMYEVEYSAVTPQMRKAAKSFNFGIPYGMGIGSLAILLHGVNNEATREDAVEKYEMYFKNQPNTRKFFADVKELAATYKYTVTQFKRYRYYNFEDKDGNFSNSRRGAALRQAGNAVIQGTAADIFKIAVARTFNTIRKYGMLGHWLITNMIHDEMLMEVDIQHLNISKILAMTGERMQFKIDGYPPLFIGAGVGNAWGVAKDKMAEIHPKLLDQIMAENKDVSPFLAQYNPNADSKAVEKYFLDRNYEFRKRKILDYVNNPENWGKVLHPTLGNLMNLQFNYGRGDDPKKYTGPNGEKYNADEFLELNLKDFLEEFKDELIEVNGEKASIDKFRASELEVDAEEEKDYDDEDEEGEDGYDDSYLDAADELAARKNFKLLEEKDDSTFGVSVKDMINGFTVCLLRKQRICGIDVRGVSRNSMDVVIDYLCKHEADPSDPSSLRVEFLKDGYVLNETEAYVKDVDAGEILRKLKSKVKI